MARRIDRKACLEVIHQWFEGKDSPLVAFPDKTGFHNVVYLYHDDAVNMYDEIVRLMARVYKTIGVPVMIFIDPIDRAPRTAYTLDEWLKVMSS